MSTENRLVVVSNRLPLTLRKVGEGWRSDPSSGGLSTALEPVLKRTGGLWIGWPGDAGDGNREARRVALQRWSRDGYVPVELPEDVSKGFYHGFANGTLWPVLHQFPTRMDFHAADWRAYVEANERFRDVVLEHLRPGDLVWVHDYQLMLLPRLLRDAIPHASIGFFLHIPFPPSDIFRILPHRDELLRGLLGADCIAFQTHGHLQHFRSSLLRILGLSSRMDRVELPGRFARLEASPIGIVPDLFTTLLDHDRKTGESLAELERRYRGRRLLVAVDRLDYTKGIPERLKAFRRLLESEPRLRGRVVLVQVAVPSRERVHRYRELRHEVNALVGEINGGLGSPEWTPVVYVRRPVTRSMLVALYAAADVGWVTPLRDGMNLVAKEYVACQRDRAGVLLLSEFAGAAAEMGEAFLVNPYHVDEMAATLARVLDLPEEERRDRMKVLQRRVRRNNALAWSERLVAVLREARDTRVHGRTRQPLAVPEEDLVRAWRDERPRLVLLGYDGTLLSDSRPARDLAPPASLLELLGQLAGGPDRLVAVVSARSRGDMARWLGSVCGLYLVAEDGALLKRPGEGWEPLFRPIPGDWKERVLPLLEHYTQRTPGSLVEEKEFALTWSYHMAEPEFGEWLANELVSTLEELLADAEVSAVRRHKSVEVRPVWVHQRDIARRLEQFGPTPGLRLAVGSSDELIEQLPPEAWTVHVGEEPSRARFSLPDPESACRLLARLCVTTPSAPQPKTIAVESKP